ncbi:hypothetical protein [Mesorhizobium sp.]|uniref:hypothetical protein n=2 Tax=Mesorhizobium sp. TaxID=1871066 RepID=UPI000FEA9B1C|nr:hypothetical protein [Mesorhizobium sp.]RWE70820.1 MAG: hypothetical protein EOS62_01985 [Mesorhizobium sp.]
MVSLGNAPRCSYFDCRPTSNRRPDRLVERNNDLVRPEEPKIAAGKFLGKIAVRISRVEKPRAMPQPVALIFELRQFHLPGLDAPTPEVGTSWKILESTKEITRRDSSGTIYSKPVFPAAVKALHGKRIKVASWMSRWRRKSYGFDDQGEQV